MTHGDEGVKEASEAIGKKTSISELLIIIGWREVRDEEQRLQSGTEGTEGTAHGERSPSWEQLEGMLMMNAAAK